MMDVPMFVSVGNQAFAVEHILMVEWDRNAKSDDEEAVTLLLSNGEGLSYSYRYDEAKDLLRVVGLLT